MIRKLFTLFLLSTCLTFSVQVEARQKTIDQLTVYGSPDATWIALLAKKFEEETKIKVNWVRESTGVILQRLKSEKNTPKADVWFGGTLDGHVEAAKFGILQAYQPTPVNDLHPLFRNPTGKNLSTGVYGTLLGFAVNEPLLKKMGKPIPKTWDELLNPIYKGLIAMANPTTSGTAFTTLATLVKMKGEQGAFEFFKKLHNNIAQYTQSGAAPGLMAARGEVAIAILFLADATKNKVKGYPINEVIPQDGTGYEIGGLSLIKNGPNTEAGKKFIDWVLQPKVQEWAPSVDSFQVPTNSKAKIGPNIFTFERAKLIDLTAEWMMANRERLIKKWSEEVFALAKK